MVAALYFGLLMNLLIPKAIAAQKKALIIIVFHELRKIPQQYQKSISFILPCLLLYYEILLNTKYRLKCLKMLFILNWQNYITIPCRKNIFKFNMIMFSFFIDSMAERTSYDSS